MQRRTRLALIAAALMSLTLEGSASSPPPEGFISAFRLGMDDPLFGGLSAIEVSDDGARFVVLSDRGSYMRGTIVRDASGAIVRVALTRPALLKSNTDAPLQDGRNDSEGLAIAPDGTAFVSFEGATRVLRYDDIGGLAQNLPTPRDFAAFPRNASFEALAIDPQGRLYTFPEELRGSKRIRLLTGQPGNPGGANFPVWRFAGGGWTQPFFLPRRDSYLPVGADFGPDGRLYVLERQFRGIAGFGSRVRSFVVGDRGLSDEKTVLQTPIGLHDNLEGLSVWRDSAGDIRLTMVSDDNFIVLQRTELVEYRVVN
jgi:hypothetical protein